MSLRKKSTIVKNDVNNDNKIVKKEDINILNEQLYKRVILTDTIFLKPRDINNQLDTTILNNLKKKLEGYCIEAGYVMHNTVEIISRTLGINNPANFDGNVMYNIRYSALTCSPSVGQVIVCKVGSIDKSQIVCYIETENNKSPLEIFLSKHNHLGNTEFLTLKQNDIIKVKIAGSTFMAKDTQIICIGEYISYS